MQKLTLLIGLIILLHGCVTTGQVLFSIPEKPKEGAKYLFYIHGITLEELRPEHKRSKDFEKILDSLASNGFQVLSEHREVVVIESYAKVIVDQVNALLSKGVAARNITVSGYSKGSLITQTISGFLQNPDINFVLISGCTDLYKIDYSKMQGRILSIYDKDDEGFFSCSKRISAKNKGVTFKEVSLSSGRGHRIFRLPEERYLDLWLDPLLAWVK